MKYSLISSEKKINIFINVCKLFIFSIVSIYLLGNFEPFFEGQDSYLYGIESVFIANGIYEISNPLYEKTGNLEFTGGNWNPTIHNTIIPIAGIGTPILGSIAFFIGGYYGLFYLGPILGIVLLVTYERISTRLFGKYVGLLSLMFLSTCHIFFRSAIHINTDAILALFFIPGIFYLIKFLRGGNSNNILIASAFFVFATLIKIPATVYFPLEIITIAAFLIFQFKRKKLSKNSSFRFSNFDKLKTSKTFLYLLIPWIIFFIFWFSYNDYFYGDPLSTYSSVFTQGQSTTSSRIGSLTTFDINDYEQSKDYSKYLLPYQFPATFNKIDNNFEHIFGNNWLGLVPIPITIFALFLSFKYNFFKLELLVFIFFILGIIFFYSGQASEERASYGLPARYMLPAILLSFIIWSMIIIQIFNKLKEKNQLQILRPILMVGVGIFFIFAFFYSPSVQFFFDPSMISNPYEKISRYPLDLENIPANSILMTTRTDLAIEYGLVPFSLNSPPLWNSDKKELFKDLLSTEYPIFTTKQVINESELDGMQYLIQNYDIYVKNYSDSFCKIHYGTSNSDSECLSINNSIEP